MIKVKMFQSDSIIDLETQLNKWMQPEVDEKTPHIENMLQTESAFMLMDPLSRTPKPMTLTTITIFYR